MKKLNIALVDDCPTDIFNLKMGLLRTGDYNLVLVAMNGSDFLKKLEKDKPELDLLLIDLRMPVLNGIETIKLLNKQKINFKILVISHGFYSSASQELQENGIIHYCQKNIESILKIIPSVLEGTSAYRDRELTKSWEQQSQNSPLRVKDDAYWRDYIGPVDIKIIKLIAKGKNAKQIANSLGYEPSSIEKYRTNMLNILEVNNAAHLVSWGFSHGILDASDVFSDRLE